ncbi:transglycosylase SLT domain-containing protein [Rhizobium helianthi]|uniref:Transglycosylase SLT domain-containing protein n=1 Tax=Rhizobium helianthi TaxID=1132695 RepID=A0ABW4M6C9_9HYPH
MAITRLIGSKTVVVAAICGAVSSCSSVQTASNTPAKADVAAVQPQSPSQSGEQTASAEGGAAAKTGRLAVSAPELAAASGPVAVPTGSITQVAEKGGRVYTLALPTGSSAIRAQNDAVIASLAGKEQQMAAAMQTPALAVAPTSVDKSAGLQAINMATATSKVAAPAVAPSSLAAPASAQVTALPQEMTAAYTAIPTPRPRIAPSAPSNMVAYAAPAKPVSAMSADFFPPAPGEAIPQTAAMSSPELNKLIKRYAGLYGVPESLVHRVVHRESKYDPQAFNKRGFFGLMQIKYSTAKSMGYTGTPQGLLDAETNLKYAIKYLRGAWLVAENEPDDAIKLYARGYYYDAKRKDMLHVLKP